MSIILEKCYIICQRFSVTWLSVLMLPDIDPLFVTDPTAGPSASEQTAWCLDELTLHENIKKTLIKFCVPSPTVFR